MKIYGVFIGNNFEDGNMIDPMFKLKSDALMQANAEVRKRNENGDNYVIGKDDRWRYGFDYIAVLEYEVIIKP